MRRALAIQQVTLRRFIKISPAHFRRLSSEETSHASAGELRVLRAANYRLFRPFAIWQIGVHETTAARPCYRRRQPQFRCAV